MSLFKDILRSDESLFKNSVALEYDYQPKVIPYRELQQRQIAACIRPLCDNRNGRNILVHGRPGIGKTAATKNLLEELELETDDVLIIYINCWNLNSTYKIFLYICEQLGQRFVQNKKTDELFRLLKQILNKKPVVFVFDEADKIEDFDFLYPLLEEIYRKTIILITNYKEWLNKLDERILSRLTPEICEFQPYNSRETLGILNERTRYAFVPGVWEPSALQLVADKTFKIQDIRSGLYLLRESGSAAEDKSSRKITELHVKTAIEKLDAFSIKDSEDLEAEEQIVLNIIKQNSGKKIGDLYQIYQAQGGSRNYKFFQRRIAKLEQGKYISVVKSKGEGGNTSIVSYIGDKVKKLSDF